MAASRFRSPYRFSGLLRVAALAAAAGLGGCVAYPAYPGYGYAPAPYYGYPAGGVAVVGDGWGWHGGGWGWHDGGDWRR